MTLNDCVAKDPSQAELLLLGSKAFYDAARLDRDRMTQALIPLNPNFVYQEELIDTLENDDCLSIMASLGAGIVISDCAVETFDISKLRYGKVILVTEQGEAGNRLRNEVLRFFSTYMRPLIDAGHVFVPETALQPGFTQQEFIDHVLNPEVRALRAIDASAIQH